MNTEELARRFLEAKNDLQQACAKITKLLEDVAESLDPQRAPTTTKPQTGIKPECPLCQSPMRKRTSFRGEFWGCTGFPQCKGTRNLDGTPTCKTANPKPNPAPPDPHDGHDPDDDDFPM